uniref:Peroxidase-like protein n=1 Tax=Crassostrea virginica TaxID=6565 RepID=A0A8B8ATF7_CRAVI|nr:peroxidase-like protein [Crassostrea virginica]
MTWTVLVCLLVPSLLETQGQSLERVVRDAVGSSFDGMRTKSLIPAEVTGTSGDWSLNRGSMAISAHNRFSRNNAPEVNQMLDDRSRMASEAAKTIASSQTVTSQIGTADAFQKVSSDPQITQSFQDAMTPLCYEIPVCDSQDPYRTADGSCNNLFNPLLGKSFTPQSRVIPNAYRNFIDLPRTLSSNNRDPLPSARVVSNAVFAGATPTSPIHSIFLTHFGQFIDHDVISTPSMTEGNPPASITDCCAPNVNKYACFPIRIPSSDPEFRGKSCMNMVRHAASVPLDCGNGVREQQNQRSSFIDGTALYGFNQERETLLRELSGGRLKESDRIDGLLPRSTCPAGISTPFHCFVAGDHRQSETPTLTVLHITWLRRHNLIADALRQATGIAHDETLFQEAKRIVVAELQHVTYTEFLPAVLDDNLMTVFNLRSRSSGYSNVYNPRVDPRTFNSFGAAVFRMGHTLVRNIVGHDDGRGRVQTFLLKDNFENPNLMFSPPNGFEYMARWMAKNAKSKGDDAIVDGLRNKLFEGPPSPFPDETSSFDLGALNIQRGREHGLPPYNVYRQFCGRQPASHFSTTAGGMVDHSRENAAKLASVYRTTDDIDLFAGGMSETPLRGGILGPTFSCLLAYQFSLYKHGDRFWYEKSDHENPLAAFTPNQLAEIKRTTQSKILCSVIKNDMGSLSYQPRLLELAGQGNRPIPCSEILGGNSLGIDIRPFADQLSSLRGSRRGGSRLALAASSFRAAPGTSSSPRRRTSRPPDNVGFKIPSPKDVLGKVLDVFGRRRQGNSRRTSPSRRRSNNRPNRRTTINRTNRRGSNTPDNTSQRSNSRDQQQSRRQNLWSRG